MIYLDIVRRALENLEPSNIQTRRGVYQQLRDGLSTALNDQDPPPDDRERVIEMRLLEMTIRQVENDLRAGVDIMASDYKPPALEAEQTRLYASRNVSRLNNASTTQGRADVSAYADQLMDLVRPIASIKSPIDFHENPMRLGTILAITLRLLRNQSAAQGKFGLLWLVLEPMILVAIIVSGYILLGQKSVVNMPLIAFAVTGIIPWLMMRSTISRVASGFIGNKELIALPAVNMLTIAFSTAFIQFLIYSVGLFVALSALVAHGDAPPPENWVGVASAYVCIWLYALTIGMALGAAAITMPFVIRFAALSMRFLGILSSIFIVSEQFPDEYKVYTLFNPLSHGFQILRSEYFVGYKSTDASLSYFVFWLAFASVAAVVLEWSRRPLLEPG